MLIAFAEEMQAEPRLAASRAASPSLPSETSTGRAGPNRIALESRFSKICSTAIGSQNMLTRSSAKSELGSRHSRPMAA